MQDRASHKKAVHTDLKTWEPFAEIFPYVKRSGSYQEPVCTVLQWELTDEKKKGGYLDIFWIST